LGGRSGRIGVQAKCKTLPEKELKEKGAGAKVKW
jgi:hypothetical protein